jgi:hypothetical protein
MAVHDRYDKGPTHGFSAQGYSAAYERERLGAEQELQSTMAGHPPDAALGDATLKDPDRELEAPASMPEGFPHQSIAGPGPNGVGNSAGDGSIDPQGQQGGTEGGQAGSSQIAIGGRPAGTPLMEHDRRKERRLDERGARPLPPGPLATDKIG